MREILKNQIRNYRSGTSAFQSAPKRLDLIAKLATTIMALAFVNLFLSAILIPQYVDWFLHSHGWNRHTAPKGEVGGVYIAIALRITFSLAWISSLTRLIGILAERKSHAVAVVRTYSGVNLVAYGYLIYAGGPWWTTPIRLRQCALATILLVASWVPAITRWLRNETASDHVKIGGRAASRH